MRGLGGCSSVGHSCNVRGSARERRLRSHRDGSHGLRPDAWRMVDGLPSERYPSAWMSFLHSWCSALNGMLERVQGGTSTAAQYSNRTDDQRLPVAFPDQIRVVMS